MIEVRNLTKRYGEKVAVDDLSFTVRPGIVTGFLGPNGARGGARRPDARPPRCFMREAGLCSHDAWLCAQRLNEPAAWWLLFD